MFWVLKRTVSLRHFLLSSHSICFGGEIRKIIFQYTLLSGGLFSSHSMKSFHLMYSESHIHSKILNILFYLQFAKGPLLKGLYWETWYNNQSVPEDQLGYIYYENKLLGVPRLRQLQVSSNSCVVHADFKDEIRDCYESYSESLENKSPFGEMDNSTAYVFHTFN